MTMRATYLPDIKVTMHEPQSTEEPTVEDRVRHRVEELAARRRPEEKGEFNELIGLEAVYRLLSGRYEGPLPLPDSVADELFPSLVPTLRSRWEVVRADAAWAEFGIPNSFAPNVRRRRADVRAALDAAARRILGKAVMVAPGRWACSQCGTDDAASLRYVGDRNIGCSKCLAGDSHTERIRQAIIAAGRPLAGNDASPKECIDAVRRATDAHEPVSWPPLPADGGDLPVQAPSPISLGSGIAWPSPERFAELLSAFCRARLFLANLEDLSVSDSRRASELRHRLRDEASEDVLRAVILFLGGVHPARPGQRELLADLLSVVRAPPERPQVRIWMRFKAGRRDQAGQQVNVLMNTHAQRR